MLRPWTRSKKLRENIALVLKYFDKLAPIMQEQDLKLRLRIRNSNRNQTNKPSARPLGEAWLFSVKLQLAATAILLIGLRSSS